MSLEELMQIAIEAREKAYVPYSHFAVFSFFLVMVLLLLSFFLFLFGPPFAGGRG